MADRKITDLAALTAPVATDLLPIIDVSEAANVDKNKSVTLGTLFRTLPDGTAGAPSIAFLSDTGTSGIYRTAANEVAISNNSSFTGKFTTAGFQLGTGTAAAQLHLFSTDTTDQVIIENTDAGLDTAPDLVLYRNSASPAANDNLGNIEFRGEDAGGNAHAYAQIIAGIQTTTDGAEDGILDLMTSAAGTVASRIRLYNQFVGIGETAPNYPLHITTTVSSTALQIEGNVDDPASSADITLYHHRNDAAGVADDIISTVYYRSKNDKATPDEVDYAAIEGSITDPSDGAEGGQLAFKIQTNGTLTTQLEINSSNATLGVRPIIPTHTPASATATGTTGELGWDNGYFYVCTATNTWKKIGISTDGIPGSTTEFSSGSVAAPSITFSSDTNTGIYNPGADEIAITTGGSEAFRVQSSGRLLVGTSSSRSQAGLAGQIQIEGTTNGSSALQIINNNSSGVTGSLITLGKTRGTDIGGTAIVEDGDQLGIIRFAGSDGVGQEHAAFIEAEVDGTPGVDDIPTKLIFGTRSAGTSLPADRVTIDPDGNVGIGLTDPDTLLTLQSAGTSTGGGPVIKLRDTYSGAWTAESNSTAIQFYSADGNGPGAGVRSQIANTVEDTTGTAQALTFWTTTGSSGQSLTERLRISHDGNVGIGDTSPQALLHIKSSSGDAEIKLEHPGGANQDIASITKVESDRSLQIKSSLGSNDRSITFFTSSTTEAARIDGSGRLLVGTASNSGGALLQVNDDRIRIATAKTPASATDTGTAGEVCWDANYIYVCTATDTWKRSAISTW